MTSKADFPCPKPQNTLCRSETITTGGIPMDGLQDHPITEQTRAVYPAILLRYETALGMFPKLSTDDEPFGSKAHQMSDSGLEGAPDYFSRNSLNVD
jgi:hypothetical protein